MKFLSKIISLVLCSLSFSLVALAQENTNVEREQEPLRILFIGNSFTFFNSLNDMTAEMLNVSGYPARDKRSAPGGWRLKQHFNGEHPEKMESTPDVLRSDKWDYVVFQEQSSGAVDHRDEFLEYGKKLNDLALEINPSSKILLYQTWERCDGMFDGYGDDEALKASVLSSWEKRYGKPNDATIEALKDGMRGGYDALARATGATVVPVGEAFHTTGARLDLFADEGDAKPFHPGPRGTYLAACCFFKTITKESPQGMWKKLNDAGKDLGVAAEDAEILEKVADETVKIDR